MTSLSSQRGRLPRRGVLVMTLLYLALLATLYLPFIAPSLSNVRWYSFSALAMLAILANFRYLQPKSFHFFDALMLLTVAAWPSITVLWSASWQYSGMRAVSLLLLLGFVLAWTSRLRARGQLWLLCYLGTAILALFSLAGLVFAATGLGAIPGTPLLVWRGGRLAGVLGNPNMIGVMAAVTGPLAMGVWWRLRDVKSTLVLCVALIALILSGSRAGILGTAIGVAVIIANRVKLSRSVVLLMLFLVIGLTIWTASETVRRETVIMATRQYDPDAPLSEQLSIERIGVTRLARLEAGWAAIRRHWLLGQGFGVGGTGRRLRGGAEVGYGLHNSYAQAWQELGIIGFLMLVVVGGRLLMIAGWLVVSEKRLRDPLLAATLAGACVGGAVDATFESWMLSVGNLGTMPFWACVAALMQVMKDRPYMPQHRFVARGPAGR